MEHVVPLLWVVVGIFILLTLNLKFKMHNVLALLIVAIFVSVAEGVHIDKIVPIIEKGLGGTLGKLALIIVFGAIIGKMMTDSGASQRIARTIIDRFGVKYLQFSLLLIGTIFGMAMFYEVAFLITAPLVISIAKEAKIPYMKLIVPTVAGATMGHSIFPPQPGPMALVTAFNANISQVYIYGLIVIVPTIICSGVILTKFIPGIAQMPLSENMAPSEAIDLEKAPNFMTSLMVPLIPAFLMIIASIINFSIDSKSTLYQIVNFFGSAEISMLIAVLVSMVVFGYKCGKTSGQVTTMMNEAIAGVSNVLLVISAGGILKEVIIESGVGDHIVGLVEKMPVSPIILAFIITVIIRILTGQGAVAAITAAGIVQPMVAAFNINPVLMVLAIACGSNTITLMYDGGFLLFKETFGISMKDTFKTWGLLELVNSLVGLAVVMLLNIVL
ncbi:gluconate permease [Latilactobacillus sakei]|nr:gluconate:H+ symporter [Latilactobacillus sakei]AUX11649.1 gluconate permease [Latilactobacillus sakei]